MKRFIAGCLMGGLLWSMATAGHTDNAPAPQDFNHYLADLQVKLDHTAQRANQPTNDQTSVVGLRGASQGSASKQLYWKGVGGDVPVTTPEVKLFRTAIDQARGGQKSAAMTTLQEFQKTYPQSALLPDVQETLLRLHSVPDTHS